MALKYLVTGCNGFIGSAITEQLINSGHYVVGIDDNNDYYDVRLKVYRLNRLERHKSFEFYNLDICQHEQLREIFKRHSFDSVLNLAARAGVRKSIEQPEHYVSTNIMGTLNLLRCCHEFEVAAYVMASTSSLYAGAEMPFVESCDVSRPISPYAATKLGAEAIAYTYHHLYNTNVSVLRYFTVFGPAGRPDMSPFRFIEFVRRGLPITLYGDGSATRDFTYISDIARGTISAINLTGYNVINLGGGRTPMTIATMIATIAIQLNKMATIEYLPAVAADMQNTAANIDKAKSLIDWQPEVETRDGFERTVQWHVDNVSLLDEIAL